MPAQLDLVAAELELADKDSREFMLKDALKKLKKIRLHYRLCTITRFNYDKWINGSRLSYHSYTV